MMCTQLCVRFDLTEDASKPRFVDGHELPNWQEGPEMVEYIRQLKNEGWNLRAGNSCMLIFERPER